jgi:hypothetical protein
MTENERRNIWPGQEWRDRKSGEVIRLDEIALSGVHAEGVVTEPASELGRALRAGLVTRSTVGERRRVHFTTLERSWERRPN